MFTELLMAIWMAGVIAFNYPIFAALQRSNHRPADMGGDSDGPLPVGLMMAMSTFLAVLWPIASPFYASYYLHRRTTFVAIAEENVAKDALLQEKLESASMAHARRELEAAIAELDPPVEPAQLVAEPAPRFRARVDSDVISRAQAFRDMNPSWATSAVQEVVPGRSFPGGTDQRWSIEGIRASEGYGIWPYKSWTLDALRVELEQLDRPGPHTYASTVRLQALRDAITEKSTISDADAC